MKYFYYVVFERNGEYEYHHTGVVCFTEEELKTQTPEEYLEHKAENFYEEGQKDGDYYWHYGEVVTRADLIREISKETYEELTNLRLLY